MNPIVGKSHMLPQFVEQRLYEDKFASAKASVGLMNCSNALADRTIDLLRIKLELQSLGLVDDVLDHSGRVVKNQDRQAIPRRRIKGGDVQIKYINLHEVAEVADAVDCTVKPLIEEKTIYLPRNIPSLTHESVMLLMRNENPEIDV